MPPGPWWQTPSRPVGTFPEDAVNWQLFSSVRHYHVRLPEFEGPLDVLLRLIQEARLDITKIALAQVTDQFLAYIQDHMEDRSPEEISAFLVVAARLLQIKSEALLPRPREVPEDEPDPGEELVEQLRRYRLFKERAAWFQERLQQGPWLFPAAPRPLPSTPALLQLEGLTLEALVRTARRFLLPQETLPRRVLKLTYIPLRRLITALRRALQRHPRLSFFQWLRGQPHQPRALVTAAFLAVLEMVRRGEVVAHQPHLFGDIWLESPTRRQQP